MKYAIEKLGLDQRCQARAEIRAEAVDEYAEAYAAKRKLPPLDVFMVDGVPLVVDGFHRVAGAAKAGVSFLETRKVGEGTIDDAAWYATSANQHHGVRRSNADKRKAVRLALESPIGQEQSSRAIAEHVGVSHQLVSEMREEWERERRPVEQVSADDNTPAEPPKRKGRDGKSYKATKPKREREVSADDNREDLSDEVPEQVSAPDTSTAMPFPPYGEQLQRGAREIAKLRVAVRSIFVDTPVAQQIERHLNDAESCALYAIPMKCPRCSGSGCDHCRARGWVDRATFEQLEATSKRLAGWKR